jgi:hypothetical protein
MGRYLDLARRALESSAGGLEGEKSEKRVLSEKGDINPDQKLGALGSEKSEISDKRVDDDPYQKLAVACLAKICRPDYPAGMIPWLGKKHPRLYEELTALLPDEIHQMWVERAPLDEFERILNLWLEAHRTSCELYVKSNGTVRR